MRRWLPLLVLLAGSPAAAGTDWLERLDRARTVQSPDDTIRAELSGRFDLDGYFLDQHAPGIIYWDHKWLANPRLALFLDAQLGSRLYAFVQTRADRGFDPAFRGDGSVRVDEYLLRWTPLGDPRLHLQAGKFATAVGAWVPRHDAWTNAFVNAPLPYERVTAVRDVVTPGTVEGFLAGRDLDDMKKDWVPVVWGPSYTAGASAFGRVARLEWAVEVKNGAPSARPHVWDPSVRTWEHPSAGGRLAWHPDAAWTFGTSLASGPYLQDEAERTLAPGQHVGDFRQSLIGGDVSYARRGLELWGEALASRFEVPIARPRPDTLDADTVGYYVEARQSLTTQVWGALRWNQQLFGDVPDGRGHDVAWDRAAWRVDAALGYRFTRWAQAKVQYGFTHQDGPLQQGPQLVAVQVSVRF